MKNLLFKEFKLSVHPLVYFFMILFSLAAIAPGTPFFTCIIYFFVTYTFLFIGIKKGVTTNDLFYTINLPVRRKDAVKARIFSTSILQIIYLILIIAIMAYRVLKIEANMTPEEFEELGTFGASIPQISVLLAGGFLSYAVFDLIYLPWFYKTGKSVIGNMFVGMFVGALMSFFITVMPFIFGNSEEMLDIFAINGANANYVLQIGIVLGSIILWVLSKILVCHVSTKNLLKLDF